MRYYRRNSDEELRRLEREYQSGDLAALPKYNAVRKRMGLEPIIPLKLEFGYQPGLPVTALAAWGCRAILTSRGADLVPDRQRLIGDTQEAEELKNVLNSGVLARMQTEIRRLINMSIIRANEAREVVLINEPTDYGKEIIIIGNTNASYGYLYLVAFFAPNDWAAPPQFCERCGKSVEGDELIKCMAEECGHKVCEECIFKYCWWAGHTICKNHSYSKCDMCEEFICPSADCRKEFPSVYCDNCGRSRCSECAEESCPCEEEEVCDSCKEIIELCDECQSEYCPCDPCECNRCDECGEEIDECYECGEKHCRDCEPCEFEDED